MTERIPVAPVHSSATANKSSVTDAWFQRLTNAVGIIGEDAMIWASRFLVINDDEKGTVWWRPERKSVLSRASPDSLVL